MGIRRTLLACVIAVGVGCSAGTAGVSEENAATFCELTEEIDHVYEAANDQQLTPEAEQDVAERVAALRLVIPAQYSDDFRLRYWPTTDVSGLDTSGTSAQRAYDRMQALYERTCGTS